MRKTAAILTLFTAFSPLPARSETPSVDLVRQPCTTLKPGNPRFSEGVGIVFDMSVPRRIVEDAVELWAGCEGYETDFPPLLIGREGTQTYEVKFVRTTSGQPRCGSFQGRSIVLYAFAVDRTGRLRSCGSRVDTLAHELGHALGLRDAPEDPACYEHTMAQIHVSKRIRRRVQPSECQAVAERWVTRQERDRESAAVRVAGVE